MTTGDTQHLSTSREDMENLRREGFDSIGARNWTDAVGTWVLYTAVQPDDAEGWAMSILATREGGRLREAEILGAAAIDRFPHHWRILSEWALIPFARRDWPEAARRWARIRAKFPDDVQALLRSAAVAEELGEHDGAAEFLFTARQAANETPETLVASARFFDRRGLHHVAVPLWRKAATGEHPDVATVEDLLRSLNSARMFDETEKTAASYLAQSEPTEAILRASALSAVGRSDWVTAVIRWQSMVDAFPDNVDARSHLGEALWHQQVAEGIDSTDAVPHADDRRPDAMPDAKALAMSFESLGDNCEFGLFQRHCGAEPIGLYRWGGVSIPSLIDAIGARFEGMGDDANTTLSGKPGDEYVLRDRRDWLEAHTFVGYDRDQFTRIYERQTAAVRFLRERLLQDIEEPWKILVYKPRSGSIAEHELAALHGALHAIGDAPFMCVVVPDDADEVGSVQRLARGLYLGKIARVSAAARRDEIDYPGWLVLCRKAADAARADGYQVGRA